MSAVGETNKVGGARKEQEAFPNEEAGIHNLGGGCCFPSLFLHPFFTLPHPRQINEDEL